MGLLQISGQGYTILNNTLPNIHGMYLKITLSIYMNATQLAAKLNLTHSQSLRRRTDKSQSLLAESPHKRLWEWMNAGKVGHFLWCFQQTHVCLKMTRFLKTAYHAESKQRKPSVVCSLSACIQPVLIFAGLCQAECLIINREQACFTWFVSSA